MIRDTLDKKYIKFETNWRLWTNVPSKKHIE